MPVPGGEITSTETWTENQAAYDAAMAEELEKAKDLIKDDEDDLPELS